MTDQEMTIFYCDKDIREMDKEELIEVIHEMYKENIRLRKDAERDQRSHRSIWQKFLSR